jgi:hypothetical protein
VNESSELDPIIEKVRDTLRGSASVTPDPRAVARVLSTVFSAPRPAAWRRVLLGWRMPKLSALGASGLAAAALLLGFVSRGAVSTRVESSPVASEGTSTAEYPVQLAAYDAAAPVPTQFVFESPASQEISIVGDFNDWKVGATPLQRLPNGLWTATVPLVPGRHVYAYVLNGTLLVTDPRAPKASDADYGREGSVVMVFAR